MDKQAVVSWERRGALGLALGASRAYGGFQLGLDAKRGLRVEGGQGRRLLGLCSSRACSWEGEEKSTS